MSEAHKPRKPSHDQLDLMKHRFEVSGDGLVVKNKYHKSPEVGEPVGTNLGKGYLRVWVSGSPFLAHHVVWFLTYGEWPEQPIDHIDGNGTNNEPKNLRLSSHKNNQRAFANISGRIGYRGVSRGKRRYSSSFTVDCKSYHIGYYDTPEEAAIARDLYVYEELGWPYEGLNTIGKWAVGYYHQSMPEKINLQGF